MIWQEKDIRIRGYARKLEILNTFDVPKRIANWISISTE